MIPKTIHYCWFGGQDIPKEYLTYIDEWKDIHPEWEIKKWDESNFIDDSQYYKNSLENKNWANVSNYARLKVLSIYGGVYLDTDVKVVKSFNGLLCNDCFLGFEEGSEVDDIFWVNNAVQGAVPCHPFICKCIEVLLSDFDGVESANESSPKLATKVLIDFFCLKKYGKQELKDGILILDKKSFYPIPWNLAKETKNYEQYISSDTYAIHMWGRTWYSKEMMLEMIDDLHFAIHQQKNIILTLKNEMNSQSIEIQKYNKKSVKQIVLIKNLRDKVKGLNVIIDEKNKLINELKK